MLPCFSWYNLLELFILKNFNHRSKENNKMSPVLSCSIMSDSFCSHGLSSARLFCPWGFSRQEYWSGLPCPPPGNLPNPGIEPRSPTLQADSLPSEPPGKPSPPGDLPNPGIEPRSPHCRLILYCLSHQGSPRILKWVAYPSSSETSRLRNQTGVSCLAGGFFTS